ncbi:MAG: DUF4349 domain-containing protein [Cyanobacteria bacterium J06632_22]
MVWKTVFCRSCIAGVLLGLYGVTGCAAAPNLTEVAGDVAAEAPQATIPTESIEREAADSAALPTDAAVPAGRPQLIKRASLTLEISSIDEQLGDISRLIAAEQGDILDLQDRDPNSNLRSAFIRIRVPQGRLEALMERLVEIGKVDSRTMTAEDVSTQLVDLQARVRNLRQSEAALLEIMDRSGSIGDVLEVSRELSNVRQQIEQLDAQYKNLQTQVSYSTLELTLRSPASANGGQPQPLGQTLGNTWQSATQSVGELTTGLLQLGLWILAYSPYLAIVAIATALGYRSLRRPGSEGGQS